MHGHPSKAIISCAVSVLLMFVATGSNAADAVSSGRVSSLTLRDGYVMFRLLSETGANVCAPCPADPGNFNTGGYCWIPETEKAKLATLFLARAQDSMVSGRVPGLTTNCNLVQMSLHDG